MEIHRNEYGHIVISDTGRGLTGHDELEILERDPFIRRDHAGYDVPPTLRGGPLYVVDEDVKIFLRNAYEQQQLAPDRCYCIAIMPTKELAYPTSRNLMKWATDKYNYRQPTAGVAIQVLHAWPALRVVTTDFLRVGVLHPALLTAKGPRILATSFSSGSSQFLNGVHGGESYVWEKDFTGVAFFVGDPKW